MLAALLLATAAATTPAAPAPTPPPASHFAYDPRVPLESVTTGVETRGDVVIQDLSYASREGRRVPAYLVIPPGRGPFPAAVWGHGCRETSPAKSRRAFLDGAEALARSGVVSLLVDAPAGRPAPASDPTTLDGNPLGGLVDAVVDARRGLDLLLARPEVDPRRLAYVAHACSASVGATLSGVDRRFKAVVTVTRATGKDPVALLREALGLPNPAPER